MLNMVLVAAQDMQLTDAASSRAWPLLQWCHTGMYVFLINIFNPFATSVSLLTVEKLTHIRVYGSERVKNLHTANKAMKIRSYVKEIDSFRHCASLLNQSVTWLKGAQYNSLSFEL